MSDATFHQPAPATTAIQENHAIVMGGSIAGLLAARVLLDHFDRVTLLERDQFPESPDIRPGVPQGAHVHALLLRGLQIIEQLFPGIVADLQQDGAELRDWIYHWKFLSIWGWLEQHESGLESLCCSRLLIEWHLRQRLLKFHNFVLRPGCYIKGVEVDPADNNRITGVHYLQKSALDSPPDHLHTMAATLVVDATGRQSQLPQYLAKLGYETPPTTIVNSFLGYASRWYKRPANDVADPDSEGIFLIASPGETKRGGVLYPVEGNRWLVTLSGIAGDHPPGDEAGFIAFMKSQRDPIFYERLKDAEPCSPIYCYRRTENQWRHYEKISLPAGLIALGDAVCCFNPIYGQGMTAAAMGAMTLDKTLREFLPTSHDSATQLVLNHRLTQTFQARLATTLKTPWLMATGEDFRWKETEGDRPGWVSQQLQRYFDRVLQLARVDAMAHRLFIQVAHLVKPPTALFSPRMIWKALRPVHQ